MAHAVKYTAKSAFHSLGQGPQAVLLSATPSQGCVPSSQEQRLWLLLDWQQQFPVNTHPSEVTWTTFLLQKIKGSNVTVSSPGYKRLFRLSTLIQNTKYKMLPI